MKKNILYCVSLAFLLVGCSSFRPGDISEESTSQVTQLVRSTKSWNGSLLPSYPEGQPEVTMLKISIPPHARLPMHHHPVINAGLLTKGELTVITREGEKRRLCAGDPIVEVVNTMHYGINEGTKTAEIIVWYAGVEKESLTVIDEMIPDVGDYGH